MGSERLSAGFALFLLLTVCAGQIFAATCNPPSVNFGAGQLTISSDGCSLHQVLTAVGRETGIAIELPPSTHTVPVFAHIGPGDPKRVVSALLDGISFNWNLAFDDEEKPGRLTRVALAERVIPTGLERASLEATAVPKLANRSLEAVRAKAEAVPEDPNSGQQHRRAEIDDSTLSKLPALPPGVPTAMWQLYPGIVANGGVVNQGDKSTLTSASASASDSSASSSTSAPGFQGPYGKGCVSCPIPPGVDPRIVTLYPPNLLQLIGPIRSGGKQ